MYALLLCALLAACPATGSTGSASVSADRAGFAVRCTADTFFSAHRFVNGREYTEITIAGIPFSVKPGEPRLPLITGRVPLDGPDVSIRGSINEIRSTIHYADAVLPNPVRHIPAGGRSEPVYTYEEDPGIYGGTAAYPEQALTWETVTAGDSTFLLYRYCPLRWNPASGELRFVREAELRFDTAQPLRRTAALQADSTARWYDAGTSWYRIPLARSGMMRITHAQLTAAGAVPDSAGLPYLGLYHNGAAVPLHIVGGEDGTFDAGDALLFFADAAPDSVIQCRHYTDSTVYWLKTGGTEPGLRMPLQDGTVSGGAPAGTTAFTVHLEEDNITYTNRLDAVTLRYFWTLLAYPPAVVNIPFDVHDPAPADSMDVTVRFRGMTSVSTVNPDHHLLFSLNGTPLPDLYADGDGVITYHGRIAAGMLVPGTDTLTVSLPGDTPAGEVDALYLDWVRIEGVRRTTAFDGGITLYAGPHADSLLRTFTVDSLRSPALWIYRHDTGALITGVTDAAGAGTYTARFTVPVGTAVRITVTAQSAVDTVPALTPAVLRDVSATEGNYIIITQPALAAQAARLYALRRDYSGLTPVTVYFDDIVNTYNYGVFNPEAIHAYLQYAWDTWTVRPEYVLILGDASWDYKKAEYDRPNIVPSVGNPANDNFFACVAGDDYLPDLFIGRLPAVDGSEAARMVDKILAYEADSSGGAWRGSYLFLNGGQDAQERASFAANTNSIITASVTAGSTYTRTTVISKQLDDCVWDENRDTILSAFNRGAAWANFSGHGGSWTWDCMFSHNNIAQLTNRGALPFVTSMTCHTGRFAEPGLECFGESFLESSDDGAMAFFGTTGWGYILGDYYLSKYLYRAVLQKGYTDLGRAVADAKTALYGSFGGTYRELVEYYSLLGDPALRLKIPDGPDFAPVADTLRFSPAQPFENMAVTVSFSIANYGVVCSSAVRCGLYYDEPGNVAYRIASVTVPPGSLERELSVVWTPPAGKQTYTVYLSIDDPDSVSEWDENNNTVAGVLEIFSEPLVNCRPLDKAVVAAAGTDLVSVTGEWSPDTLDFYFLLDTVPACTTAFARSSGAVRSAANSALFATGSLKQGQTYYWRSRLFNGVQFSQWSPPQSFTVDTAAATGGWYERAAYQFGTDSLGPGAGIAGSGITLGRSIDSVDCAHLDRGASVPMVTSKTSHTDPRNLIGGAFDTTVPSEVQNFIFGKQDSFQLAVVDLGQVRPLRRIASRHYGGKGDREVWSYFSVSTSVDSQDFTRWGERGPFDTPDNNISDSVMFQMDDDMPVRYIVFNYGLNSPDYSGSGSRIIETYAYRGRYAAAGNVVSTPVGPAAAWDSFRWDAAGDSGTVVAVGIEGLNAVTNGWEPLGTAYDTATVSLLSGVDAGQYPYVRLIAALSTDDRFTSPVLNGWGVAFRPAGELTISSLTVSTDSAVTGDTVRVTATVLNTAGSAAETCSVAVRWNGVPATGSGIAGRIVCRPGIPETLRTFFVPDSAGTGAVRMTVNADSVVPEICYANNSAVIPVFVGRSNTVTPRFAAGFIGNCRTYPVPSRTAMTTSFVLDRPGTVHISVYTATGNVVLTQHRFCNPGHHVFRWSAADIPDGRLRSGLYFIRVSSGGSTVWSTGVITD